jgi:hypothetical protein
MGNEVDLDNVSDNELINLWGAVMGQVAKDYIELYAAYLKEGPNATIKLYASKKRFPVKKSIIELEDYILGDLIAGPHADYIVHGLRDEAKLFMKGDN